MLLCLANPFADQHPLSARVFTEKFFPHSSFFPCSLALLSPFGCECTAAFTPTDSDRARGHWHYCLSTCWNLLLSSGLSVLIPSNFIAAFFWFGSLFLIRISFLSFYSLLSVLHRSWTSSSNLLKIPPGRSYRLTIGSAGELMEKHMHWNIVGAKTITHLPWDHMRPLPKTQKWTDHWYQCIQLYMITSNNMATFSVEQSLTIKQLTIRLFCFSAPLTPHSLSFPTCFLF